MARRRGISSSLGEQKEHQVQESAGLHQGTGKKRQKAGRLEQKMTPHMAFDGIRHTKAMAV